MLQSLEHNKARVDIDTCLLEYTQNCLEFYDVEIGEPGSKKLSKVFREFSEIGCSDDFSRACMEGGFAALFAPKVSNDIKFARESFRQACDLSDMEGCVETIRLMSKGYGGVLDLVGAKSIALKGCEQEHAESCTALKAVEKIMNMPKLTAQELNLLKTSCYQNAAIDACSTLGEAYLRGILVDRNIHFAKELLSSACSTHGNALACFNLAEMHRFGMFEEINLNTVQSLYAYACSNDVEEACSAGLELLSPTIAYAEFFRQ